MLKFTIPSLPASMNKIYDIIPYWSQKRIEVRLSDDVMLWKNNAKAYIPKWDEDVPADSNGTLWIGFEIHNNWMTKELKFKKLDLQNLLKVLIDTIAERLGFNDCMIFEMRSVKKIQTMDNPKVMVELGYL